MDNIISLEAHRAPCLQRRADEFLLDLVKDGTTAQWALVDRIVSRAEFTGTSLADIGAYLDVLDAGRMGLDEQA